MTITQFVENVHVSRVSVLNAIRTLFPEKEIKNGVPIELNENEVAVLSYHFTHSTSNNCGVTKDIRDAGGMSTRQIAELLGVTDQAVYDATRRLFPSKEIVHGVTTFYNENEVAILSKDLHHTTSNNSGVSQNAFTSKELLLNLFELLNRNDSQVNLGLLTRIVLDISNDDADHVLKAFTQLFTTKNTAVRFRAAFSISDLVDKYWDIQKIHPTIPLIEED